MKLLCIILLIKLSLSSNAEDSDVNTLTLRSTYKDSKTYKITKIYKSSLGPNQGTAITIETEGEEKCVIPIDRMINVPRAQHESCAVCEENYKEKEDQYIQLFLNSKNPKISCDITEGETVGFHFLGSTEINGTGMFTSKGMIFDIVTFSDGPFDEPVKSPSAIEGMFNSIGNVLLKYAF